MNASPSFLWNRIPLCVSINKHDRSVVPIFVVACRPAAPLATPVVEKTSLFADCRSRSSLSTRVTIQISYNHGQLTIYCMRFCSLKSNESTSLRYIYDLSYAYRRSVLIVCYNLYSSCASIKPFWSIANPTNIRQTINCCLLINNEWIHGLQCGITATASNPHEEVERSTRSDYGEWSSEGWVRIGFHTIQKR